MRRPVDLDQDRVVALVLRLSGPAILGISAHALQMLVNAWFVADLGAAAIATMELLTRLELAHCHSLGDADVHALDLPGKPLTWLSLAHCSALTDVAMEALPSAGLEVLDLEGLGGCTDAGMTVALPSLCSLVSLNIGWCQTLTNTTVEALPPNATTSPSCPSPTASRSRAPRRRRCSPASASEA